MGIGECAEKSVGAAHVCVGNHDNPASSNYQASSHWVVKDQVESTYLQKDGRDETQEMQATRFKREWSIAHGECFKARECW